MKISQRDELKERQRMKKEGLMEVVDDTDHDNLGNDGGEEEGDLFGDSEMDIGWFQAGFLAFFIILSTTTTRSISVSINSRCLSEHQTNHTSLYD